ncbi:MAG: filamentous hemagglutinin N-terminal domain-containing protein, partial [Gammaproteobacteria bacterium]|nr:filamentous hemagglutinin N-terminal domain-containing protein [Gammaproteobacteria bacterium]
MLAATSSFANPTGADVTRGQVQFNHPDPTTLNITNSNGAIINWQDFSIQQNEVTRFIQGSANSAILNRVTGQDPSNILGQLLSNGRVFVINPNGIVFGQNSIVDTAGLIASTLDMTDEDFINGNLKFQGENAGAIQNMGYIKAGANGDIFLIAPNIENSGVIETEGSKIILAAGEGITIASLDSDHIVFDVQAPDNEVVNLGQLITNGGAAKMFAGTIRHSGSINADSISIDEYGRVVLSAGADTWVTDDATISAGGNKGGRIEILGERVALMGSARIDASGETGGGEVLFGGDYQGNNANINNAEYSFVGENTEIKADAITTGNGGKVIVWADETAKIHGDISAKGGSESGNGGFVETSAIENLQITKTPDLTAENGTGGEWLIDPNDIAIVAGGGNTNINSANPFASTNDGAQLGINLIKSALIGGSSVSVTTTTSGTDAENGDINLNTDLDINSTGINNTLTLSAHGDININNKIFDSFGIDDVLNLTLIADSDSVGGGQINIGADINVNAGLIDAQSSGSGDVRFSGTRTIDSNFNATSLTIDGADNISFNGTTNTFANLNITSGTVTGAGDIIVTSAFTFGGSTSDAILRGSGTLTTNAGVTTTLATNATSGPDAYLNDTRAWSNFGTVN